MWHIRPQHSPANQLCRPLQCVPHSSSSIQLFLFFSPPSFSMLSWVCPAFVVFRGPGQCNAAVIVRFFPHDVADELPSPPLDVLTEVFHFSHLQDFFVCNSVLPAYLKYPLKTSALPIHFHCITAAQIYLQQFTLVHINFQSHLFCFMGKLIGPWSECVAWSMIVGPYHLQSRDF